MADPFTMLAIGSALLGGAMGSRAARQSGAATAAGLEFQADLAEKQGTQKEALIRRRTRRRQGALRTAVGKSGVTMEGSPMMALADSAAEAEIDALNARFDAQATARLKRLEAKGARKAAKSQSGASLLGGIGQALGGLF